MLTGLSNVLGNVNPRESTANSRGAERLLLQTKSWRERQRAKENMQRKRGASERRSTRLINEKLGNKGSRLHREHCHLLTQGLTTSNENSIDTILSICMRQTADRSLHPDCSEPLLRTCQCAATCIIPNNCTCRRHTALMHFCVSIMGLKQVRLFT